MNEETTYPQTLANVLTNWIKPLVDSGKLEYENIKPDILAKMVELYDSKQITSTQMRQWINDRIGEKQIEQELKDLGVSDNAIRLIDLAEVQSLSKKIH